MKVLQWRYVSHIRQSFTIINLDVRVSRSPLELDIPTPLVIPLLFPHRDDESTSPG